MVGNPEIECQNWERHLMNAPPLPCESTGKSWSNYGPVTLSEYGKTAFAQLEANDRALCIGARNAVR
jgi:hypothetical protein